MNNNIIDDEFWFTNDTQNITLQNTFLLYITTKYNSTMYDKLTCCISSLSGEVYIQKIITTAHPQHYLEMFCIEFNTSFKLSQWLEINTFL